MIPLVLKATVLLLLGALAALLLHRRSAALRHLVWTTALAAAVAVALGSPLLPDLSLPIPGWPAGLESPPPEAVDRLTAPAEASPGAPTRVAAAPAAPHPTPGIDWPAVLPFLWAAGFLLVAGWIGLGRIGLGRLLRNAQPLDDAAWQSDLSACRRRAGLGRRVGLYLSADIGCPVTWGVLDPVIVLPESAEGWSGERRRVVLSHELAHVARGDGVAALIGWLACAVYWFHPLAWLALRRLRNEAERAADDRVLGLGVPPVEYAGHLLDVARGSRALRLLGATAIGMARPSSLEGRLLAVLDDTRNRRAPRSFARRATLIGFAALAIPLAAITPAAESHVLAAPAWLTEWPQAQSDTTLEESYPAKPGERLELDLEPGAEVRIEGWDQAAVRIRATLSGSDRRNTTIEFRHRGLPGIQMRMRQQNVQGWSSTSHRLAIAVPRRYDVRIKSGGGAVTIIGVVGTFSGHTGGGGLRLMGTEGVAQLDIGGGDIEVSDSELDGRVSTGGGQVRLSNVRGNLRGSSGSGPVIRVGDRAGEKGDLAGVTVDRGGRTVRDTRGEAGGHAGMLHVERAGGAIELPAAPNGADVETGGGAIRIGEGAGLVKATTGGGDITVGPGGRLDRGLVGRRHPASHPHERGRLGPVLDGKRGRGGDAPRGLSRAVRAGDRVHAESRTHEHHERLGARALGDRRVGRESGHAPEVRPRVRPRGRRTRGRPDQDRERQHHDPARPVATAPRATRP